MQEMFQVRSTVFARIQNIFTEPLICFRYFSIAQFQQSKLEKTLRKKPVVAMEECTTTCSLFFWMKEWSSHQLLITLHLEMFLNFLSGVIYVLNFTVTLLTNIILKMSNRAKPEALISELDPIFNDIINVYTSSSVITNGYPLMSIFLEGIDPTLDFILSLAQGCMGHVFLLFIGWTSLIQIMHIYQFSSCLEGLTYDNILWIVRSIKQQLLVMLSF